MSIAKAVVADIPVAAPGRVPLASDEVERMARLRLARSENVGPRTFLHLVRRFGSAERALDALPMLAARGGKLEYIPCPIDVVEVEAESGARAGAIMVLLGDPNYPRLLSQIDNPPPVIWTMGDLEFASKRCVAIVGARNASALGMRTARRLAYDLGGLGFTITSGLARGIDTAAHESALESGTIAVMAGGLDQVYPAENQELAEQIAEQGLLLSECAMGVEPTSRHFPRRNRLISGVSQGVLLIEAAKRSGSLITARYALEQGREAMACPGAAEDPRAGGCNAMIRDGAALIRNAEDVIDALEGPRTLGLEEPETEFLFDAVSPAELSDPDDLSSETFQEPSDSEEALMRGLLSLLSPTAIDRDALLRATGASPGALSLALLELELAGRIEVGRGGEIALKP